jgi:hypothetical protein
MALENITDDTPLLLRVAAKLAYPDGSMTISGLRRERDRGNLVVERVAGKEYTTLADIKNMRAKCRDRRREPASSTTRATAVGTSGTASSGSALAALKRSAQELRKSSGHTSKASTPHTSGSVIPIGSKS